MVRVSTPSAPRAHSVPVTPRVPGNPLVKTMLTLTDWTSSTTNQPEIQQLTALLQSTLLIRTDTM